MVVPAPTVTGVTGNSATGYTVTGTATPGDTVSIKNTGGTVIGTAVADAGGNYTVTIPAGLATPVEQLKAVATDPSGNQSTATPFTTPADPVVVTAPTVDSVTGNSSTGYTVTGTAPAGDVVTIKNSGGTVVGTATADPSGNYTVVIPVGSATPNEQLTATATDGAGNTSAGTPFTTPADPVVVPAPTVTGVTGTSATGYTVTGTATPGDTVSIKNTGGTVIGTAVADAGGNYTVTIPAGLATPVEQLKAVATDPSGNQSTATPFTTPADPVIVTAPTVDSVTGNSSTGYTVTGTAPAGDVVTIKNSGGTVVGTATADPSGNYTVVIPVGSATPNEQLTATATDGAGNTSAGTPFTTPADPVVVPAPTVTGVTGNSATGYTVTGTATPGDTVSIKNTGGTVIGTAVADAGGNYTVTIPAGLATPVEQLKAVATDPSGNQSTATPFTTPADPVVVTAPTVDSVTGNSSTGYTVTGTAPAGDVVTIKNSGGTVVGTATADPSGNYTVVIPVGSATPNEQLTATATDGAGNTSAGTPFTTPADPVVVPAPTVTGVTGTSATGYTVTGTATPGDTVSIKNTGGTVIGTAVADAGGNYTVTIPAGLATPVEQLKAVATDPSGNQSTATPFTTPADPVVVTAPTVDSVTGNSSTGYTVTGTAPAGDVVTIKNSGGTVVGTATADPSGNYTVVIPVGSATPNEQLTATATDGAGNTSAGTPFTTPADPVVVPAPTVTGVTGNSATGYTVTGTATPGDTVSIKNTGGTVIGTAVADAGGNYTVTIPAGLATPVEQLKAVATDPSGNQSTATPFTTPADPVVVTAPTVDSVTGNSSTGYTVTGTAPAGDVVTIKNSGGTVVGTATADPSGNYTVVIPVGSATPNEQLTATATDGAGNTSAGTPFTTPADPVVVPAPTVTGVTGTSATGYTVTGTATPGDTVSIKNTGGTVIGTAVADAGGNYTVTIPAGLATPVEQLKAVATDPSGNQSTATPFTTPADPVVVTAPTVDSVTGNSSSGYVVNGKATAGNTVEIRNTSGTVIGTVVADASGNYMVSIPVGSATQKEQLKAIAKDGAGNTSTATLFMTPADPAVIVATPTISKVTGSSLTGYTIIGKATPGNKVEIRNSDNELLGQAIAAADGGFTITLPIGLAVPNEQLTAIAKDSNNNQSAPAVFNLPNDPNTRSVKPPTVNSVTGSSTTGYTVNGTADPDYVINIYNPSGVMVATGEVDDSGNYSVKIPAGMAMPNEKDTAVAFDANGNRSIPTEFVIPADSGSNNGGNGSNGLLTNNGKSSSLGGTQKNLPNNGEIVSNWALLGSFLLAGLGLFSLKRRNKKKKNKSLS
ncbi:Ig-like domain-containing protein [Candidatus Enterococcus mansonii]|uniref:Ig-like domain-containing protein n=1 Tax=Candidatus Enterococcus mansonii TaxID=1834181 RepID=UPI003AF85D93